MPDSTKNFSIDTSNAPVGAETVTRSEFINILEHLNYASGTIRSIDESSTAGLLAIDGSGSANSRTLTAGTGITVSNGNGSAGNPTVGIDGATAWNQLHTTESNTITLDKHVSIIGVAGSYALPTPTVSQVFCKIVINNSSGNAVLTGSSIADKNAMGTATTSITIPTNNMAILYSDLAQKWYLQNSTRLLAQ